MYRNDCVVTLIGFNVRIWLTCKIVVLILRINYTCCLFILNWYLMCPAITARGDLQKWQDVCVFGFVNSRFRIISEYYVGGTPESLYSDCSMWRCISMFGLQYVETNQYVRDIACGDVSVCSEYSMWRYISMFWLQYVAVCLYVCPVRRGVISVYAVTIFGNLLLCQNYVGGEVSVRPVTTSSTMLRHTNKNSRFMEFAVTVPIAQWWALGFILCHALKDNNHSQ
jgi:hypothetical protein